MAEIIGEIITSEFGEKVMESIGDSTERWSDRWWFKALSWAIMIAPFIGIAIYYWVL